MPGALEDSIPTLVTPVTWDTHETRDTVSLGCLPGSPAPIGSPGYTRGAGAFWDVMSWLKRL